jgi:hypothetical protein
MKFTIFDALNYLQPSARFGILDDDYDQIDWHSEDKIKPTREEVEIVLAKFNTDYVNTEYQRKRVEEYPSIGDQLDALFHAGVFPDEMAAQIQAIKNKYPKN